MSLFGIFGNITNPYGSQGLNVSAYSGSTSGQGLIVIFSSLIRLSVVVAGIYTLINFILAGYTYLSANGDQKAVQTAVAKIWRSVLGLIIVTGSLLLAGIIGYIIFGPDNWSLLISPKIYAP